MELTQVQYELIRDSIERYRLTMTHRFMVFNDEDIHRANVLRKDLGINEPLPKFSLRANAVSHSSDSRAVVWPQLQ